MADVAERLCPLAGAWREGLRDVRGDAGMYRDADHMTECRLSLVKNTRQSDISSLLLIKPGVSLMYVSHN